jgi:hypothetical protein
MRSGKATRSFVATGLLLAFGCGGTGPDDIPTDAPAPPLDATSTAPSEAAGPAEAGGPRAIADGGGAVDAHADVSESDGAGGSDAALESSFVDRVVDDASAVQESGAPEASAAESSEAGGDGAAPAPRTGTPCAQSSQCGATRFCSTALSDPIFPTPVCLSAVTCDPGTGGVQFCDGASPTDGASPGVCVPTGTPGEGVCLPICTVIGDGSPVPAPASGGCAGKDACNVLASGSLPAAGPFAIGFCFGGCLVDGDCPSGSKCQTDDGTCVKTPVVRTKKLGAACTASDTLAPGACNCIYNAAAMAGICSQFCTVGTPAGGPGGCPAGYACDSDLPSQIDLGDAGLFPGFATQNPGLAGSCLPTCSPAGDAGTCPRGIACSARNTVGAVCLP